MTVSAIQSPKISTDGLKLAAAISLALFAVLVLLLAPDLNAHADVATLAVWP